MMGQIMGQKVTYEVTGEYEIENDIITVKYRGRQKSTQVGRSPVETLARMLLREMVNEAAEGRKSH